MYGTVSWDVQVSYGTVASIALYIIFGHRLRLRREREAHGDKTYPHGDSDVGDPLLRR